MVKLGQATLSYLAMLGISSKQSLANVKYVAAELILISHPCWDCAFFINEAKTFREYTYSIFFFSTTSMVAACFTILATKRKHIFKLVEIGEKLVEKSE